MSDHSIEVFKRQSREAVDQTVSTAQLHEWMEAGDLDKVAVQLIPWVTGDKCLGAVRASFNRYNGGDLLEYDDLHAQAMMLMMDLLHKWEPGGMTVMSWVATYTKQGLYKYCIKFLRGDNEVKDWSTAGEYESRTSAEEFMTDLLLKDRTPYTEDLVGRDQAADLISGAEVYLTPRQREIFSLYYRNDLTQEAIGGILGISKQAVQESLKTSLTKIKRQL